MSRSATSFETCGRTSTGRGSSARLRGAPVVVCGHGGLETALGYDLRWKKGAVLVLDGDLEIVQRLRA